MSKKVVLGVEVIERNRAGVEISVVKLTKEAKRGLSTGGAEIAAPPVRPKSDD